MPAALETIDYEGIVNRDPAEIDKLLKACQAATGKGLFFLDLRCPAGKQVLSDLPKFGQAMLSYFSQPTETKMKDYREGVERGSELPSEAFQTFEISHNEHQQASYHLPLALQPYQSEIASILDAGYLLTKTLLQHLHPAAAADLASGKGPSDTCLKLCLQSAALPEKSVVAAPHVDTGLLTFVSYDVACLELAENISLSTSSAGTGGQKEEDEKEEKPIEWSLVEPKDDCVLVNVGDALQDASQGALRSPLHRVIQPRDPKPKGICLVGYFLMPEQKKQK